MKMKIVQLEVQGERSLSAKDAFERYAGVTLVQTTTAEGFVRELESGEIDLLLCSPADFFKEEIALVARRTQMSLSFCWRRKRNECVFSRTQA